MTRSVPFFMVYGLGKHYPTHVHNTVESAEAEANRLAAKHPGIPFYVLGTIGRALHVAVQYSRIEPYEVPF